MAQIGMPFRIGLGAMLVLAVAYLTFLKPSDEAAPPPAAPGVTGLSNAVDSAKAAAAQDPTGEGLPAPVGIRKPAGPPPAGAVGETPSSTANKALAELEKGDRSAEILRQLAAGRTVVVLFSSPAASEDVHVRGVLRGIDRHRGTVRVHHVGIADVGRYGAITRGVQVTHAPTLLVIGKDLEARRIVGYTDRAEVNQLVNDVSGLHARVRPSSYRALVQNGCATTKYNIEGDGKSLAERRVRVLAFRDDVQALAKRLRAATVPARYGAFNAQYVRYLTDIDRTLARLEPRSPESAYDAAVKRLGELDDRISAHAAGTGLRCAA